MKTRTPIFLAAALVIATGAGAGEHPGQASDHHNEHGGHSASSSSHSHHQEAQDAAMSEQVNATVVSVHPEGRQLLLDHEAIEFVGMGAMTMGFNVGPEVDLERIKAGDTVRFTLEMQPGKGMVITEVEAR